MILAARFLRLFAGLERAHGTYMIDAHQPGGKIKGDARTRQEPVTEELWRAHLAGERGLGIIPIRDDGTCGFAAIDVDKYDVDLKKLAKKIAHHQLPLVVCRTKSGGAHLYLFGDMSASLARSRMGEFSVFLGAGGSEIFPKQDALASHEDTGNWINMPYFDAERSVRYALGADGKALTAEAFLRLAESMRVDEVKLRAVVLPEADFEDGPPCLQELSRIGFPEGSRNNGLFNCGVYARMRWEDDWEEKVWEYNRGYMTPGAPAEVKSILSSLKKKDYGYQCRQQPIVDHCARATCQKRRYGIGGNVQSELVIDGITKIDSEEPVFFVNANGHRLRCDFETLSSQAKFRNLVGKRVDRVLPVIKAARWEALVNKALESVVVQEAPPDASKDGMIWGLVEAFCTSAGARGKDEILAGRPWTDDGWTWFQSAHLRKFITDRGYKIEPHELWALLNARKPKKEFWIIKGAGRNVWGLPAFDKVDGPKAGEA